MDNGQITGADLHLEAPVSQWRGRADASSKVMCWLSEEAFLSSCEHFLKTCQTSSLRLQLICAMICPQLRIASISAPETLLAPVSWAAETGSQKFVSR